VSYPTCSICGAHTTETTYGGKVSGLLVDFVNKETGDVRLALCTQCLLKIRYGMESRDAISRGSDNDMTRY